MQTCLKVIITTKTSNSNIVREIGRFRKRLFVDALRWNLPFAAEVEERDQFDRDDTVYAALCDSETIIGCFRAIRADQSYLTQSLFPQLARERAYPRGPDVWEISRFGILPGLGAEAARANYAAMFRFATTRQARALVALVDLTYERFLRRLGIVSHRYGEPELIDHDLDGRPVWAVAGEIPIHEQTGPAYEALLALGRDMEIVDEALVFGRMRLSA